MGNSILDIVVGSGLIILTVDLKSCSEVLKDWKMKNFVGFMWRVVWSR